MFRIDLNFKFVQLVLKQGQDPNDSNVVSEEVFYVNRELA